jgi:uncharacterized secreted protein with C-terminal beta-propeller domain
MKRLSLLLSLTLLAAACAAGTPSTTTTGGSGGPTAGPVGLFASSLVQFDQCDALRDYYVEAALEQVGPYGLGGGNIYYAVEDLALESAATEGPVAVNDGASSQQGVAGVDYSTTNVQEAGVDEPDSVKTDGNYIYSLLQGQLQVIDVQGASPREVANLTFDDMGAYGMLMAGDRLLVSGSSWGDGRYYSEVYRMVVVDISDPTDPSVIQTMEVDGTGVSSRLIGDTVHIVLRSFPVGFD